MGTNLNTASGEAAALPPTGRREFAARCWTANVLAILLAAAALAASAAPEHLEPLPPELAREVEGLLGPMARRCTSFLARVLGSEVSVRAGAVEMVAPDGRHLSFALSPLPRGWTGAWLLMALGGAAAAWVWPLGWVRRAVVILVGLVLPAVLLPALNGVALAVVMATSTVTEQLTRSALFVAADTAVLLAALVVAAAWWVTKAMVVEQADGPAEAAPRSARMRPPLLWAAAGLAWLAMPVLLLAAALSRFHFGLGPTAALRVLAHGAALVLTGTLLVLGLLRYGRAARWAWAPLLLMAAVGGGGLPGALLALGVVLAINDGRAAALWGRPTGASAARRIDRRAARPLTAVAWILVLPALARASAVVAYAFFGFGWWLTPVSWPAWVVIPPAALGVGLAVWEVVALRRRGKGRLAMAPGIAAAIGVVALAAGETAWHVGMRPPRPVAWPAGVRVDEGHRLLSFPTKLGPFVLLADGELGPGRDGQADGEVVLGGDELRVLGVLTEDAPGRLAARKANWYLYRLYHDTRQGRAFPRWSVFVTYYTGLQERQPHVPETALTAGGAEVLDSATVAFNLPAAPQPWNRFEVRRVRYRLIRAGPSAADQQAMYEVYSLDGRPETSPGKIGQALGAPRVRHRYFARIQICPLELFRAAQLAQVDRAAEQFLAHVIPAVLEALPAADDAEKLKSR